MYVKYQLRRGTSSQRGIRSVLVLLFLIFALFYFPVRAESAGGVRGQLTVNGVPDVGAVIFLRDLNRPPAPVPSMSVTIRAEKFKFKPKLSLVTVGATVTFQNNDFEVHNAKSDSPENKFDLGMIAAGTSKKTVLKNPGAVDLRCRVHSDMGGLIFVSPSPFFTFIEHDGQFDLSGVPPGDYEIYVWHPERETPDLKPKGIAVQIGPGITTVNLDWKGNTLTRKNP
jgi:plastocyanin